MKKTFAIIGTISILLLASLFLSLSSQSQTVNMGRTYIASQNVRYANEGATGTTLNKLAKLTGAPSTAIITAITDTSGIIGIVVSGAGTTGSADIAIAGKASCVFDGATTAGHYVIQSTSAAGECKDGGATYPTSGQVIGVVTSTNGGAGTYEVDLSLRQPQAGGGSGSGNTTATGTDAAKTPTGAGNLYFPNNGFVMYRDTGATMVPWGPLFPLTLPDDSPFAWENQGAATVVTTNGGIYISTAASGPAQLHARYKAKSGTYKVTVGIIPSIPSGGFPRFSIGWRESGSGKYVTLSYISSPIGAQPFSLWVHKWDSATSADGTYSTNFPLPDRNFVFLQIEVNSINRVCRVGWDGINFLDVNSVSNTDFITADEIMYSITSDNSTFPVGTTIVSWKEEIIP